MTWVKLDQGFYSHPKARAAGKDGRALFLAALCFANTNGTNGRIADTDLPFLAATAEVRARVVDTLVAVGLFEPCGEGWMIHDYLEYQPPAEKVRAKREAAAERMRTIRARSQHVPANVRENKERSSPEVRPTRSRTRSDIPSGISPAADTAGRITAAFWQEADPKPSTPFVAIRQRVEEFLLAGWSDREIGVALVETRAFTRDALEYVLRERRNGSKTKSPPGMAAITAMVQGS